MACRGKPTWMQIISYNAVTPPKSTCKQECYVATWNRRDNEQCTRRATLNRLEAELFTLQTCQQHVWFPSVSASSGTLKHTITSLREHGPWTNQLQDKTRCYSVYTLATSSVVQVSVFYSASCSMCDNCRNQLLRYLFVALHRLLLAFSRTLCSTIRSFTNNKGQVLDNKGRLRTAVCQLQTVTVYECWRTRTKPNFGSTVCVRPPNT